MNGMEWNGMKQCGVFGGVLNIDYFDVAYTLPTMYDMQQSYADQRSSHPL